MSKNFKYRLIPSALIFTALTVAFASPSRGADDPILKRAEAVRRPATVDCSKIKAHSKTRASSPRPSDSLVQVGTPVKLNDESAPSVLTAGVWSPAGDSIAFVSPTNEVQALAADKASAFTGDPANAPAKAVGISVNEIWVYQVQQKKWNRITDDGGRPRFSVDGKRLFYLSSSKGARAVDMATLADESLGAPEAGDPNQRFSTEILSDGTVLSPDRSSWVLKQAGAVESSWAAIELAPQDEVRMAPNEQRIAVIYNANEGSSESAVVVYDKAGRAKTVLRNCPDATLHMTWSQDGSSLVYAVRATGQPEVWESKMDGGYPLAARLRLSPSERIGALSLSPDNELVALSQSSHTGRESIWVAGKRGMQKVASGLLGQWSPHGGQILYAARRSGEGFDWYVIPVTLQTTQR